MTPRGKEYALRGRAGSTSASQAAAATDPRNGGPASAATAFSSGRKRLTEPRGRMSTKQFDKGFDHLKKKSPDAHRVNCSGHRQGHRQKAQRFFPSSTLLVPGLPLNIHVLFIGTCTRAIVGGAIFLWDKVPGCPAECRRPRSTLCCALWWRVLVALRPVPLPPPTPPLCAPTKTATATWTVGARVVCT